MHDVLGERSRPVLVANCAGVSFACGDGIQDLDLACPGVSMFSNIEVKADRGEVRCRVDSVLLQEVRRQNCRLP